MSEWTSVLLCMVGGCGNGETSNGGGDGVRIGGDGAKQLL